MLWESLNLMVLIILYQGFAPAKNSLNSEYVLWYMPQVLATIGLINYGRTHCYAAENVICDNAFIYT